MNVPSVVSPETMAHLQAMAKTVPPGIFVELGVYRGGTAHALVAAAPDRELHLFDTFAGIPFQHEGDHHKVGDFADTSEAEVRALLPKAIFHVGVFPKTMPKGLKPIAFCHIDADQKQSYEDAIALFSPLMVPGGVMWFDDVDLLPAPTEVVTRVFGKRLDRSAGKPFVRF